MKLRNALPGAFFALFCAIAIANISIPTALAAGSDIKVIVNKVPITALDVSHRTAFLKLQRKKGNLASLATEELIDEALKRAEMRRIGLSVPDKEVAAAFARFATSNKMKLPQLEDILNKSGVTSKHFKEYIRMQMGWGQAVSSRYRATSRVTEQEAVRKMMEKGGGTKPSATEYLLQQVIFVVPAAKRGAILGSASAKPKPCGVDTQAARARCPLPKD